MVLERFVFQSRKCGGRVVALGNRGLGWSPRSVADVAGDIGSGRVRYLVRWESGVVVVSVSDSGELWAPGPGDEGGGLLLLPDG